MIALPGINNKHAVPTPINPEQRPIINVSAVNTCDTLRLLAPTPFINSLPKYYKIKSN